MNPRKTAIEILIKIDQGGYSSKLLGKYLKKFHDNRDKNLLTAIVYGVLRQRQRLDYIIAAFSSRPQEKMDREVIAALRMALFQLEFLDRIPPRAAVNESVSVLKDLTNRGAAGFANGLLRNYLRNKNSVTWPDKEENIIEYLSVCYSHPRWLVEKWLNRYGEKRTERLLRYNNYPPAVQVRRNTLKLEREEFERSFQEQRITFTKNRVPGSYTLHGVENITSLPYYQEGGFYIQGEAATLAGLLLAVEPGMQVLDMAAGPGGKTTHLGELMKNRGEIIALDKHGHRLKMVEENCRRLGIEIVETVKTDARRFTGKKKFDRILLDAPCTGTGILAQKPEIKWNRRKSDIKNLADLQLDMLQQAVKLLKPGGIILYSTCTLIREENQENINEIIRQNEKMKIENIDTDLTRLGLDVHFSTGGEDWLELFPPESETEGFFLAKMALEK